MRQVSAGDARPDVARHAPLLDVRHLTVEFGPAGRARPAVNDVSFQILPGETLGLVGESGSGKSMTAFSILRLLPPGGRITSGEILFDGGNLLQLGEREMREVRGARISLIFQEPMTALNPVMRVGDQIAEALLRARPLARIGGAAGGRAAGGRAHSGCRPPRPRLPPPAVRWHAPARDDCHRARLQAAARDRRRADDRARRHHPGADPRPAARAAGALQPGVPDHHPRLRRDRRDGRPRGRDARRAASSRTGPVRQILRAPAHAYTQRLLAAVPGLGA